jgi:hypothetical protein
MSDTPKRYSTTTGAEIDPWKRIADLERELAEARKDAERYRCLLVSIREAMIIQGVNQRITDWKHMIAGIDAAMKEQK